jgi:branched-chain amino acid transport system substrate-binding protein
MIIRVFPLLAVIVFLGVGLVVEPPSKLSEDDTITIVSSLPRSGSAKGQTDTIVEGINLAIHEADEDPTRPGTQIRLGERWYTINYLDLDDATAAAGAWTPEQEINNANQARRDPDVMAYIGTYNSGAAKISMPILNRANLLMISPANTSPGLTKPNMGERDEPKRYRPTGQVTYVRVVATDDLQGPAAAEWAKSMGVRKVYILDDNEVYGKGVADLFEVHARKIGLEVLGRESIDAKAQEFGALMTKIRRKGPDLIYFGGTTQSKAGQIAKDMVKAGMTTCKMMGPDGCYEQAMIASAGADTLEGRFYATFCGLTPEQLTETPEGRKFIEAYRTAYGREPSEAYTLYGYECGRIALEAIRLAGKKDRAAICAAGRSIKDFPGVTGRFSFDENGDTTLKDLSGVVVRGGKFVFEKTLSIRE